MENQFSHLKFNSIPYSEDTPTETPIINMGESVEEVPTNEIPAQDAEPVQTYAQEPQSNEDEPSFTPFINHLVEKNILYKTDKQYQDSEEGFEEAFKDTINAMWEDKLAGLSDKAKKLLEYDLEGLNIENYTQTVDFSRLDYTDINTQRDLVLDALIAQDYTEEEAEEQMSRYEDTGLLEAEARRAGKFLDRLQKEDLARKEAEDRAKIQAKKDAEVRQQEELKREILGTRKLGNFDVSEKDAQDLYDYMTKPVRNGKTQSELDDTKENRFLLALLRMKKFDTSALERKAETKVVKSLKDNLNRYQDKNAKPVQSSEAEKEEEGKPNLKWWKM